MKKISAVLLALTLIISLFSPVSAYAWADITPDETSSIDSANITPDETFSIDSADITPDETFPIDSAGITPDETLPIDSAGKADSKFELVFERADEDGHITASPRSYVNLNVMYLNLTGKIVKGEVSSSNPAVASVVNNSVSFSSQSLDFSEIALRTEKCGSTTITISADEEKYTVRINVVAGTVEINSIRQTASNTIKLSWNKQEGISGYYIDRAPVSASYDYKTVKTIKTIKNGAATSVSIPAEWKKNYTYWVRGYVIDPQNNKIYCQQTVNMNDYHKEFSAVARGSAIASVQKSGSSSLKISWKPLDNATGYELYRSTKENGVYKKIYTAKKGTINSYKQKVKKGTTYYYKLVTITPNGKSDRSPSVSGFIPKSSKAVSKNLPSGEDESWGTSYYYEADGKPHVVCEHSNGNLKIYTLDSNMNVKKTKTVKLGKYDSFGSFYQGTDGKFYVAVGFSNPKESKKKTVIKVYQYSSKWKKLKTASIKGNVFHGYEGIRSPFAAGSCRMDMQGNTLYIHTCRTMFVTDDGLNHQSNISFAIDTRKMKAKVSGDCYASHSFDQYVKFKDGNLYLLDHGDAYPRCAYLTIVNNYNTKNETLAYYYTFKFKGKTGENYTGARLGGMEIGTNNVLTVGAAQPHGYKVKGVTGFKPSTSSYGFNIYLTVTNKETGKTNVKWLTTYHPSKKTTEVSQPRIVKLSDSRFAILYNTTQKGRTRLNYVVIDENGKKVYTKTYKNMDFDSNNQPILTNGQIMWSCSGKVYSIPAKTK